MVCNWSIFKKIIRKQPWSFKIYSNNVLTRNGRWISYREKSENLHPAKNENLAIPDEKAMLQAITWIHYQLYYWLQSDVALIPEIDLSENGWMIVNGNVQSVWVVGKSSSPNFVSNIMQIWVSRLTSIPLTLSKATGLLKVEIN